MSEQTSDVDLLMKLLDRVPDADALERLLDAENLLAVLKHVGRSEDDVRAAIEGGARPGDLLLEVLDEGHHADDLLTILPPPGEARQETKPRSSAARAPREKREKRPKREKITFESLGLTTLNKVGGIVAIVAIVIPGMIVGGFFPLWYGGDPVPWYVVALSLGAIGGALFARGRTPIWVGALGGAAAAVGGVALIVAMTADRLSVLKLELVLWVVLGALPGFLLYLLLGRLTRRASDAA